MKWSRCSQEASWISGSKVWTSLLLSPWSCINLISDVMLPNLLLENLSLSVLCRIIWVQEEYGSDCPKQINYQIVLQKREVYLDQQIQGLQPLWTICKFPPVPPRRTLLSKGKEVRRAAVNKGFPGGASGQD